MELVPKEVYSFGTRMAPRNRLQFCEHLVLHGRTQIAHSSGCIVLVVGLLQFDGLMLRSTQTGGCDGSACQKEEFLGSQMPMKFYLSCDIIEFLEGDDAEGVQLSELFAQHGVHHHLERATDHTSVETLFTAFSSRISARNEKAKANGEPLYCPELHLSCHGCVDGIQWHDGSIVEWQRLANLLWEYSKSLGYFSIPDEDAAFAEQTSLVSLQLSCCYGAAANEVFYRNQPFPIFGFMAPSEAIVVSDCADFFLKYYTDFATGNVWDAPTRVDKLNKTLRTQGKKGDTNFLCYMAPVTANPIYAPKNL